MLHALYKCFKNPQEPVYGAVLSRYLKPNDLWPVSCAIAAKRLNVRYYSSSCDVDAFRCWDIAACMALFASSLQMFCLTLMVNDSSDGAKDRI